MEVQPSAALLAICQRLPKIELHAHLNGCVRESTLLELARLRNLDPDVMKLASRGATTLHRRARSGAVGMVLTLHERAQSA